MLLQMELFILFYLWPGGSSAGKESACNEADPYLIPGSGSSPGEGIGYPLQYSWVSLVAQLVKNLPVTWESWVQFLGWEDPHSSILAWRIPSPRGCKESDMTEQLSLTTHQDFQIKLDSV